jgi:hypothetical protein
MKASAILAPAIIFVAAAGITASLSSVQSVARDSSEVESEEKGRAAGKDPRDMAVGIRALLRAGDIEGARGLMEELAAGDPYEFFEVLAKLPLIKEFDGAVTIAAARLPWGEREAIRTLNGTGCPHWRHLAWDAYCAAQDGKVPDEEIIAMDDKADCFASIHPLVTLMKQAARKRPQEFAKTLKGVQLSLIRGAFLETVANERPELTGEIFALVNEEPTDASNRFEMMQTAALGEPTAENLMATLNALNGIFSPNLSTTALSCACQKASPEQRDQIYDAIAALPPLARNRMIEAIRYASNDWNQSPEEFCRALAISTSRSSQMDILRDWIKGAKNLEGDVWIENLPGDDLKAEARKLIAKKKQQ